jgi:hypothetical protein
MNFVPNFMFRLYGYFVFDQSGKFSEMAKFRVFLLCCNESVQFLFILFSSLISDGVQSSSIFVILNTISNHTDRTKNMTSMTNLITVQYM